MNDGLHPYPDYKQTGLPWLGSVPVSWEIARTKRHFRLRIEKSAANHGQDLLSIYTHIGVRPRKELEQKGNKATTTDGYWVVKCGDIIVNKLLAWMGAVGVSHYHGVTSPAYDILMPVGNEVESDYFHYLFRTGTYLQLFKARSRGIMDMRLRLYFDEFGQIPLIIPPREEQRTIVRYLDANSRLVNKFIRNRRRLIEVLNEQKQAIISRAVTRGLDPNVKLKPTAIEGLGDVPQHWQITRIGRVIDLVTGFPFASSGFTTNATDVRLLRGINVSPGRIRWDSVVRWPVSDDVEFSSYELAEGDIVFGMDRPLIKSGVRAAIVKKDDVPSLLLQRVARLRAKSDVTQNYLYLLFQDRRYAEYLAPLFSGISVPHISPAQISDYRAALPPITEQRAILQHIAAHSQCIDVVIKNAEREIDLMREYRTRLVADVVTGKLDVRHLAPPPGSLEEEELAGIEADNSLDDESVEEDADLVEEAADAE